MKEAYLMQLFKPSYLGNTNMITLCVYVHACVMGVGGRKHTHTQRCIYVCMCMSAYACMHVCNVIFNVFEGVTLH